MDGKKCPACGLQAVQFIDVISQDEDITIWQGICMNCGHDTDYATPTDKTDNFPEGEFE